MTSNPTPEYCFHDAYQPLRRNLISREDFWRHIFRHFQGARHPEDQQIPLGRIDSIANGITIYLGSTLSAIRDVALREEYELFDDAAVDGLVRLFLAFESGDDVRMQAEFNVVTSDLKVPERLLIQPLAVMALQLNSMTGAKWVRFCFARGAKFDNNVATALYMFENQPANVGMLDWLYEHDWKRIRTSESALKDWALKSIEGSCEDGADVLNWYLDHGITFPRVDIRRALDRKIHEDALAKFIEIDREAVICWYPLHTAIRFGNVAAVKVALEAGIPPDGPRHNDPSYAEVSYWGPWGEWVEVCCPMDRLPLMETIIPQWIENPNTEENMQKRLAMARLLLEHGADVNKLGSNYQKSCLQTAREKSLPEFVTLLEEFAPPS